mgnify:FL=1|tara:strand:+ start:2262 stop:2477 length:216 start_codon:yes stop_codon:yes gene_type:complete
MEIPKIDIEFSKGDETIGVSKFKIESNEILQKEYRIYLFPIELQLTTTPNMFAIGIKIFSITFSFKLAHER